MEITQNGDKLVITVILTPQDKAALSSSGKTRIAFSSGGFTGVSGRDIKVNLTVTYPK